MTNVKDLPNSSDKEFWDGEVIHSKPSPIPICETHTKERFMEGNYIDNRDGSISCKFCPWGGRIPGYLRIKEGRIVDLRSL